MIVKLFLDKSMWQTDFRILPTLPYKQKDTFSLAHCIFLIHLSAVKTSGLNQKKKEIESLYSLADEHLSNLLQCESTDPQEEMTEALFFLGKKNIYREKKKLEDGLLAKVV